MSVLSNDIVAETAKLTADTTRLSICWLRHGLLLYHMADLCDGFLHLFTQLCGDRDCFGTPQGNGVDISLPYWYPPCFFKEQSIGRELHFKVHARFILRVFILNNNSLPIGCCQCWGCDGEIYTSRPTQIC